MNTEALVTVIVAILSIVAALRYRLLYQREARGNSLTVEGIRKLLYEANTLRVRAENTSEQMTKSVFAEITKVDSKLEHFATGRWLRFSENFSARLKESESRVVDQIIASAGENDRRFVARFQELGAAMRADFTKSVASQEERLALIRDQLTPRTTVEVCSACNGDGNVTKVTPPPLILSIREAVAENASTNGAEKIRSRAR